MTTIAYKEGVIAADTAVHDGDTYAGQCDKIWTMSNGWLGGAAGCMGDCSAFARWFLSKCDGDPPNFAEDDSEALVIRDRGNIEWIGGKGRRAFYRPEHCAIGSGFPVAAGAMAAGASAIEAVKVAARLNAFTQEPIMWFSHSGERGKIDGV